jgi:hypothetical protein
MTTALAQVSEFCTQAGRPLHSLEGEVCAGPEYGSGQSLVWHVGPLESVTECAECSSTIGTGETIVALIACHNQRRGVNAEKHAAWRHVRCHDWSTRQLVGSTTTRRVGNGRPGPKAIEKELFAAVSSPRFRLELRSGNDLRRVADRLPKYEGNRVRAIASVADRLGIDPNSPESVVIAAPDPIKVSYQPNYAPAPVVEVAPAPTVAELETIVGPAMVISAEEIIAHAEPDPIPQPASPTKALPEWAEEWLARLEYEAKRDYARQYLDHLLNGAPAPTDPRAEWADKARKRADRLRKQQAA